ncbi:hypothetical protein BKA64DRAFT_769483 [Cadophora sp. MPI-SDFR-AT-0126]|nr:hypothetical protein BKA64DRAFT_769483 [Leotiomycetes sp. MPI-SDFR-AT-0126]
MQYVITTAIATALTVASNAAATYVSVTNNCGFPVFYSHAWDRGHGGEVMIAPNGGTGYEEIVEPSDGDSFSGSLKFHKGDGNTRGILQFEYTKERRREKVPGIFWNLSHNDGDRPGIPGEGPFGDVDTVAIPLGAGQGHYLCNEVFCSADEVCEGSFQYDLDNGKVKYCPLETESFEVEFCVVDGMKKE